MNHVSFNLIIPSMAFTDVYYSGEHEQYEDLTKFRVRWQGKQWGIWPILLGDDSHSYRPLHLTYCLLHGVSVWPAGFLGRNDMLRKTANVWQAYDSFGYRQAEWIPYFRRDRPGPKRPSQRQGQPVSAAAKVRSAGCREPDARSGQLHVDGRPESDGAPRHVGRERSG